MTTDAQPIPEILTDLETIVYLRLDAKPGDAMERLRNLIRRQRLPVHQRGQTRWFRRSAIDAWLAASKRGAK